MQRFMGMMPSSEVRKEKHFKDRSGLRITVQAGEKGWTVLWADGASSYKDINASTDENWAAAVSYLASKGFSDLAEMPAAGER